MSVSKDDPMIRVTDTGELEVFWESVPKSPVEFEYMLKIPEGEIESKRIIESHVLYYYRSSGEKHARILPEFLSFTHSAEIAGDINDDGRLTLGDAVIALKVAAEDSAADLRADYAESCVDVNGDDKAGIEEAIFILTKMTEENIEY